MGFQGILRKLVILNNGSQFLKLIWILHLHWFMYIMLYFLLFSHQAFVGLNTLFLWLFKKKTLFLQKHHVFFNFLQVLVHCCFHEVEMLSVCFSSACFKVNGLCIDCLHQSRSYDFIFLIFLLFRSVMATPFVMANTTWVNMITLY